MFNLAGSGMILSTGPGAGILQLRTCRIGFLSHMRILLVEDEPKVRDFVVRGLTAERYAVDSAEDGEKGLQLASSYHYDLIILDLMLPRVDGAEVLRRIRSRDANVPVLVLTARDAVHDKVLTFEAGADDYLTKPFAFAELLVRTKALLRRGPVSRASSARIADLELDRLTQQVKRSGKRIDLTGKEYALLEYLMLNAGRVLSRHMIIEHVWDQSFDGLTNIVDVYVRHLRNKVDEGFEPKLIQTVRGVGYTIREAGNG
ncbi:MAG TPA: response regulator transcription factor [Terriglobales bacterium]|nr:response regulator transcription factor [Terriglobales bacterium]